MPFGYYKNLTVAQRRIYDQSDHVTSVEVPYPERLFPILYAVKEALLKGNRAATESAVQEFINHFCLSLKVPLVRAQVLERRPSRHWGEMHGLYQVLPRGAYLITVWMRTAKRIQAVAFKTFLRTVLHELLHHLDYTYYKLADSFHTKGFYSRESSLLKQLWIEPGAVRHGLASN
jgi:hypothetical protein